MTASPFGTGPAGSGFRQGADPVAAGYTVNRGGAL